MRRAGAKVKAALLRQRENLDLRPLQMAPVTRRQFLKTAMLVSASAVWAKHFPTASTVSWHERRDLFPEGVASGDPNSNSVLLWTRSAPVGQPHPSHLMLEVAEDQDFHRVVAKQSVPISAEAQPHIRRLLQITGVEKRLTML
jgi:phosphodiesterase/alkaline phosphatase D-like protein